MRDLIGHCSTVHHVDWPVHLLSLYEHALLRHLRGRGLNVRSQVAIRRGRWGLKTWRQRLGLLVENEVVVALKAINELESSHYDVVRSHLRAVDRSQGLLLNFSKPKLEARRVTAADISVPPVAEPRSPSTLVRSAAETIVAATSLLKPDLARVWRARDEITPPASLVRLHRFGKALIRGRGKSDGEPDEVTKARVA